ncbi:hypothetical protein YC2023_004388 [Brassica napus]
MRGCPSAHTGRPWLSVCVCVCLSAHTGRPWLSISTHIRTLVLGLSTLALPMDCSGDFGPRGLSVQYTQDVRGCPPAHTGRPWQSMAVPHTGRPWLSISTHISTLVLGLSTLTLPVDCSGDFGPRGLSVQYTQDVRECPPAHTGRPWLSVSTHKTSMAVRVCPCVSVSTHRMSVAVCVCPLAHTGRPWLSVSVCVCPCVSVSTHMTSEAVHQYTYQHAGHSRGQFGTSLGVCQHTQDVRGCPWQSVCVRQHTQDVRGCPSVHKSARWSLDSARWPLSWTVRVILAHVGCLFTTHRTSVGVRQQTQDVRRCPPAHTGCPWVSASTHRTLLGVRQHTQNILGCLSAHTGHSWLSISTHISTLVLGLSTLTLHVDCSGDFGPRGLFVQYTQEVHGCPPAHTGRLWLSVSTHRTSVAVRQHTQDVCGCPSVHISARCTHRTSVDVRQHTQDVCGCPWLSVSTHRTYVAVRVCSCVSVSTHKTYVAVHQYTYQHVVLIGRLWVSASTHRTSVAVRQHTQVVCVSPSAHTGRPWMSISTHISTLVLGLSTLALPVDCSGDFSPRGLSLQYTQDVRGCLSAHRGRPWVSVSTHRTSVAVRVCPCESVSTHRTSVAVHQYAYQHYTQDVRRVSASTHMTSVADPHTGRLWLSLSTHISMLVLGLSMLALPGDCSGDFGPRGLSVKYTLDVCGCLPAHTGRPWLYVAVRQHTQDVCGCHVCPCVSVCVRQHTHDVRGYPSVHISARWSLYSARWPFPWTVRVILAHVGCLFSTHRRPWVSASTHRTSVGVRQNTQDVRGCPPAHTGRLWLSVAVHQHTQDVFVCPCITVCVCQHTQDVCGCPSVHISARWSLDSARWPFPWIVRTGRPWVSVSTHRMSVAVCVCLCESVSTHRTSVAFHHTHRTTVGVRLHTQDVCSCLWLFVSTHRTSVAVRVCPCVSVSTQDIRGCPSVHISALHTGCPWVSASTHRTSVGVRQHTQDVRGCPPAHTGHPWLAYAYQHAGSWTQHAGPSRGLFGYTQEVRGTHRTSVSVRQHTQDVGGCLWLSVSTHRTSVAVRVCPCVSVRTHRTSVAVHVCPSAHTRRPWLSECVCVCPSAHTGHPWLSISTHISTLVLGLSTLAIPVDCSGDFGPRGLSVQCTQDVRGCPPAHTGCLWRSVAVRHHTHDVCGCPCVSVSTQRTSEAVHQYTYQNVGPWTQHVGPWTQHVGPWTQHADPSRGLFGWFWPTWAVCSVYTRRLWVSASTHWTSVAVRQHTQDVCGCPCVSVSTHKTSVAVRVCPSAHTGRPTHRTSVGVRQHTQDVRRCPPEHTGHPWVSASTHRTSAAVRGCPSAHTGCMFVSVCVRQNTEDVCGWPSVHISARWSLNSARWPFPWSVRDVCGCPSAHRTSVAVRVCPCEFVCTHRTSVAVRISTLVVGLSMLTLPVDCLGEFGPCGLSVQYSQDVCGCPPAHTGRLWLFVSTHMTSVAVCVCLCVSVSTHKTSVAVHQTSVGVRQHTQDVRGCPSANTGRLWLSVCVHVCPAAHTGRLWLSMSTHISTLVLGLSTLALPVDCSGDFSPRGLSVQYTQDVRGCPPAHTGRSVGVRQHTQDVRGCPSAHTGRMCVSVCVRVCLSAQTGCPWLSISTYISTLVLGLSMLALPVDCLDNFGPRGLSVQYTQDVRGCPSAHTGRLWVSVSTHRTAVAGRLCPCMSVITHRTSVAVHQMSVGVRQHTQDVRGCPSANTGRLWLSVCVHVFPAAHTGHLWLSISTHISTLVLGLSTLAFPVDCSGDFSPRGLSVQYTQDVRGCPPAHTGCSIGVRQHTGRSWVSASTHRTSVAVRQHTQDVCVCPCVFVSTDRTSVAFHQYIYQHAGPWTQHAGPSRGLFGTSVGVRQHTQDGRGCPCVSVITHRTSVAVHQYTYQHVVQTGRPSVSTSTHMTSVAVRQHTQDVRGCHPVHISARWSLDSARWPFQWTVRVILAHVGCLFSAHRTSVGVRQHTQDVCGGPWLSVTTHMMSVAVRVCPSAHKGHPRLSISTHIRTLVLGLSTLVLGLSTLVLGLSTLTHPVDYSGGFGPRGLSVQYTQDVCGCPPAHTGRLWLSVSTHRTSVAVRVCPSAHTRRPWLSMCVRQHTQDVRGLHIGRPWVSASTHRTSVVVRQNTQDIRGCPPAHIGRPWLSVAVRQHTQDVCLCPCVSIRTQRTSVAGHQYTYQHAGPWTQHAGPSRGLFGTSVAVRVCPCEFVCTHRTSVAVRISTLVVGLSMLTLPVDCLGEFGPCGLSVQYSQDICGCPPAHTGRLWLFVSTHMTSVAVHQTFVGVRQHTQDVRGCPSANTGRLWLSVCVHVCPAAHTGRLWLSMSTHISTLVLGLSTLALPVDCSGDFSPRGLSVQYTQDVRGCPPAHTGRSVGVRQHTQDVRGCPSAHTGRMCVSVCVRVCLSAQTGCPWLSISTYISMLALPVDCLDNFGPRGLSVQYTQDVRGCPSAHTGRLWVSVSTHRTAVAGRLCPCMSVITHRTSVAVHQYTYQHVGPWTQHADPSRGCSGNFGPRGLSVHYTQDVRGCPPAHTGRPWLSVSKHRTSVAVRVCPCVSGSTHRTSMAVHHPRGLSVQYTQDVRGCPPAHTGRSIGVRQHTQDVRGCPPAHTGRLWLSVSTHRTYVCVRVCLSAQTGRPWLSISTYISTLVLGLSTLALPVDCLGNFGPRGLSVQYTQDVRGCLTAHTGRPWVSVSTHRTAGAVRVCPSSHTGRPWQSISTHISTLVLRLSTLVLGLSTLTLPVDCSGDFVPRGLSVQYKQDVRRTLVLGLSTLALPMDCLGDFGPRGLSVQYAQDVRGCPPAHTGRPWLSVAVRQHTQAVCVSVSTHRTFVAVCVCSCVSFSTHRTSVAVHQYTYQHLVRTRCPWLSISTHISTLVLGLSTLTLHVDCSGDFGPRGLSAQHTQDVRGCPSAHTGRPGLSVCVRHHTQDVRGSPSVHISARCTNRTSVGVHQHTHDVCGCPSAHTGRPWLSSSTHISTLVLGLSTLALPMDCLGDFGPRGLSVQYAQDVRGCPPAHTGRPWLSVAVRQHTQAVCVSVSTHRTFVAVCVCSCVSFSAHRTSVAVHQYTYQHLVRTRCPWLSISTHISTLVLGLSTLTLHVDCSGDFGPRGLSAQHTQDVRGCPPAHTRRLWLSVSTHRTSVAVRVCPTAHTRRPRLSISIHISTLVLGLSTLTLHMDFSGDFGPPGMSVRYTQDVRGCPPAHTGRLWLSVAVRQHTQDVHGCPCVSISTHRTSEAVHQYTYQHYTQDVCGCPPAHTGRPWLSVAVRQHTQGVRGCPCVSVSTHMTSVAVRVCPCVSVSTHRTSVAVHQYTYKQASPWTQHAGPSRGLFGTSVLVRQNTHDIRGCPPAHTGRLWLSVAVCQHTQDVCVCLCVSVSTHRTSVAVHQYTYQHADPWTQHAGPSRGLFGTSVAVRVCPCESVCTHRTSVAVSMSTLVVGLSMLTLPVDSSGDFGPCGLFVQYTQDVRGCPPAHTGRLWLFVSTHMTSVAVRVCLCVSVSTHRTSVAVHQYTYQHYTKDVCGCPPAHTGRPWLSVSKHRTSVAVCVCPCVSGSTHRTSVAVHQYTYQHAGPWTQHAGPSRGLFGCFSPRWLSVQYTQDDVRGCPPADTGRLWLCSVSTHRTYVYVRVCPCVFVSTDMMSAAFHHTHRTSVGVHQHTQDVCGFPSSHTGRPWLSISTHISTLVLGLSMLALPMDCLGDFGPRGLSVQNAKDVCGCPPAHTGRPWLSMAVRRHTQDVRGCPPAHTGRPWVSASTHRTSVGVRQHTQDVCGCPWLSVSTHRTSMAVRVCPSAHTGHPRLSISTHISTLVVELSTLTLPVDYSGDFCPRGLSVQYTQDVCGCPPAHTGRPWLSVSKHRTSVAVRGCPSAHTGCLCVSVCVRQHTQDIRGCPSVHISARWSLDSARWPFPWSVRVILAHVGCLFSTHRTSVGVCQHTQDVRGCPSEHRTSVAVRVWPCESVCTHRTSVAVSMSTLVVGLSMLTLPVDSSGDFGPCGLSVQYTQDVRGCPPAHTGRLWLFVSTHMTSVAVRVCLCVSIRTHRTSVAVHQYTYQHVVYKGRPWVSASTHRTSVAVRQQTQDVCGCLCVSMCVRQHTQDVCGCPSVHISARCTHRTFVGVRQHTQDVLSVSASTHRTSVGVRQQTQDVRGCPTYISTLVPGLSTLALPVDCLGRPWLSISTHISTLVLGLSMLALPMDCLGDFGPRGLSVQNAKDVCGCPPAHTGRPWLSMAVRRHTQDVCGCPPAHTGRPWVSASTHMTSVGVRQHTQDVCGCPWLSVSTHRTSMAVRVCPSAHTGHPRLSISTHISTLVVELSTLTLPVDYSGDFCPRGLSVQYTQDVCGCPPAHTGRPWLSVAVRKHTQGVRGCPCVSVSTHRTSVAVRVCPCVSVRTQRTSVAVHQYTYKQASPWTQHAGPSRGLFGTSVLVHQNTQDIRGCPPAHTGRPWLSVAVRQHTQDVCVCLCVSVSTHRTSVAVHQYTYQHAGPWTQHAGPSRGLFGTSVAVRVCPCESVCTHRTSVAVSMSTLVVGLSMLTLPMDSSGDFGPCGLSVQYTQDVRGCPPAHTGRLWLFVSTHMTSVAVRVCLCVSIRTHRTSVAVHHIQRTSVGVRQHTQDVRGCPSANTGRVWLSVCVHVCPAAHTGRLWLSISTHISTLVLGLSTLALPVDCSGVLAHVGCLFSTHRTFVGVRQHTQDVLSVSASTHRTSVGVRQQTQDVRGSCYGLREIAFEGFDENAGTGVVLTFGKVQSLHSDRTLARARSLRSDRAGRALGRYVAIELWPELGRYVATELWLELGRYVATEWDDRSVATVFDTMPRDVRDQCAGFRARPRFTPGFRGCDDSFILIPYRFKVRDRFSAYTTWRNRELVLVLFLWRKVATKFSILLKTTAFATHISTLVLGLSTLTLPVDCLGDFGPRVLSVQYTRDVRGCPPAHTGRLWLFVAVRQHTQDVRECPFMPLITHKTSVAVHQYTYQHVVHTGRPWVSASTHRTSVAVCGCPSAHTGHLCVFVCVRVCPSAHTRRLWLSISTHISTLVLGLSTLALPVDFSGDFGPRGLSVQYTQDVRGCLPAHTGRPCVSVCVHVCPSAHTGRPWLSISTHISLLVLGLSTLALPVDCLGDFGPRGLSVQYTQDVRGSHTGRPWLSVCVRVCPSAHTRRLWLSISTHISTLVLGLSTLALPVDFSGDFGPRGLSVQHTKDVCGCPSAHTDRPCVSVCVPVCPSAHTGRPWLSISTHISTLVLGLSTLALPVDCSGDFGACGLSVQYTQYVRGCPPAHTGRRWLSVAVRLPWLSVAVRQHTQDVRGFPCVSAHTGRPWLSISTHISTLVLGLSRLTLFVDCSGDFGPRGLSVQYKQDVRGCPPAHT